MNEDSSRVKNTNQSSVVVEVVVDLIVVDGMVVVVGMAVVVGAAVVIPKNNEKQDMKEVKRGSTS